MSGSFCRLVAPLGSPGKGDIAANLTNDALGRGPFLCADEYADGLPRERPDPEDDATTAIPGGLDVDVADGAVRPRPDPAPRPEIGSLADDRDAPRGDHEYRAEARHLIDDRLVQPIHRERRRSQPLAWSWCRLVAQRWAPASNDGLRTQGNAVGPIFVPANGRACVQSTDLCIHILC